MGSVQREWRLGKVCFDERGGLVKKRLKKGEKTCLELKLYPE